MNSDNNIHGPKRVKATPEQAKYALEIAVTRKIIKSTKAEEDEARENLIDTFGDDRDVVLVDGKDQVIVTSSEIIRSGSIDWVAFQLDHPDLDYDKYRKPATTSTTIRIGPVADAVASEGLKSASAKMRLLR